MKKILTLMALTLISAASFAQTIWKDTVILNGMPKDGSVHELYDTIYNTTASPITVTWNRTPGTEVLLSGWTGVGICDAYTGGGTCYSWVLSANPQSFVIPAGGKATIDIQMKAAATAMDGTSIVNVNTSVGPMTFKFISWPTATKDFDNNNFVNIYPNPATDYVNIMLNDKHITTINVVNVIGRRIAKFNVDANKNDDIRVPLDKVSNGIYLLQFADANGKVLGVRRVTKQ